MAERARKPKPKSLLREVAYERFKSELFKGNLAPGQFVSQTELCALLDVPLGPVREALKRLEAEGLVRLIPQRGIQIAEFGVTLIHHVFQFRAILEAAAVRHFVTVADDATLAELERLTTQVLRRLKVAGTADTRLADAVSQVDAGMHDLIVESLGNDIVTSAHRQNLDKIRMIDLQMSAPRALSIAMEEHLAVIAAMKTRDPERAATTLEQHLHAAERRALGL